jgi:hypothetical protein
LINLYPFFFYPFIFSLFNKYGIKIAMMESHAKTRLPKVVDNCHDLLVWMIPQLDKFPRHRRFTLGERVESTLLRMLELLVKAAYTRRKEALLQDANLQLEVLRHLWRAAFELQVLASRPYEHGARLMNALGAQIGGWAKASAGVAS